VIIHGFRDVVAFVGLVDGESGPGVGKKALTGENHTVFDLDQRGNM
jgi:hypothetical protein